MAALNNFYKRKPTDKIWWVDNTEETGLFQFSFDRKTVYNLFEDYPGNLTQEQRAQFDRENPNWRRFFE